MQLKTCTFLFLFSAKFIGSLAQDNQLLWASGCGSPDFEMTRDLVIDSDGNIISVGQFDNTVDFDHGSGTLNLTSDGQSDIFIMKQDPSGNLLWAHRFGDYANDVATAVGVDNANNIYVTGTFRYEVDFDPGAGEYILGNWGSNAGQIFLLKLTSDGNFVWANQVGNTSGSSQGLDLDVEYNGSTVVTGSFYGTVDFDPSAATAELTANTTTNYDIFIARYFETGNYQWAMQLGSTGPNTFPYEIFIGSDFSIYLTGAYSGTMDLDPTAGTQMATSNGYEDAFIIKMTSGGTFLWGKSFGGVWGDVGNSTITNVDGSVYVAGFFRQDVDFDPGAGVNIQSAGSATHGFLLKLDWNGDFVYVKTIADGSCSIEALAFDENQHIYMTGGYSLTPDFDPGVGVVNFSNTNSGNDIFVVELDASGNFVWANSYGVDGDDAATAIQFNAQDDYYLCGRFANGIDFNPSGSPYTLNAVGNNDFFVAKFGTCNLDLNVNLSGITLSAQQNGANYQWLNCSDYTAVAGATSQNFTPTSNGDYACKITYGSCVDTTNCTTISGVGLNENEAANITIYPNPTKEIVNIITDENIELVNIYNTNGELILQSKNSIINVETLSSGFYVIEILTSNQLIHKSIIKE